MTNLKPENTVDPEIPKRKSKIFHCAGNHMNRMSRFKHLSNTFDVIRTGRTVKIKHEKNTYIYPYSGCGLSYPEMNRQKKLKNHIKERFEQGLFILEHTMTRKNARYFRISEEFQNMKPGTVIEECTCFDINKAYYTAAYNMKFISEGFYNMCINLKKDQRLRLIGSIATKKRIYHYVDGKMVGEPEILEDEVLRNVWFHIVSHISWCMEEFYRQAKDKFLFYWVDGIYLRGKPEEFTEILKSIKEKYSFDFKNEELVKIVYDHTQEFDAYKILVYRKSIENMRNKKGKLIDHKPFYLEKKRNIYDFTKFADDGSTN